MKEVFNNLKNSNEETREDILKQLANKMGQQELEDWIRNSDMPDEFKQKMLQDIQNLISRRRVAKIEWKL